MLKSRVASNLIPKFILGRTILQAYDLDHLDFECCLDVLSRFCRAIYSEDFEKSGSKGGQLPLQLAQKNVRAWMPKCRLKTSRGFSMGVRKFGLGFKRKKWCRGPEWNWQHADFQAPPEEREAYPKMTPEQCFAKAMTECPSLGGLAIGYSQEVVRGSY